MKEHESKLYKCGVGLFRRSHAAWKLLGRVIGRRSVGDEVAMDDLPENQCTPKMNPLDRIKEYLLRHRLSPRVRVRLDSNTGNFVLEDDDGVVYARDYDEAVATINRTWL